MYVQFKDFKNEEIIAYFGSPQNSEYYPNLGEVEADDARWAAFYSKVHMWGDDLPAPVQSTR